MTTNSSIRGIFIACLYLIALYLTFTIYAQGELLFAGLVCVIVMSGIYVFSTPQRYHWRYLYSGLSALGIFVIFPLVCTIAISFSNYSGSNQLTYEQALKTLTQQTFIKGTSYNFKLKIAHDDAYQILLTDPNDNKRYISAPVTLTNLPSRIQMDEAPENLQLKNAPFKAITLNRKGLKSTSAVLPNGDQVIMSSLRKFSQVSPLFTYAPTTRILTNEKTGQQFKPNDEIGFFQAISSTGTFAGEHIEPGYTVGIGWSNYIKIFLDKGLQKPLLSIFLWTVTFALLSVIFVTILGMVFASLLQWEELKGKAVYRLLLILPYAVPAFISILIFKGLFNQSFGEINIILGKLFGIKPQWFNDAYLVKTMILIVNTWLGYPYMMIVCMGLLKSIPSSLYEAAAIEGATMMQNFTKVSVPMLIPPMMPLIIASFAFNFNNFVLIQLLTEGGPSMIGSSTPAGHSDLLVSYTYRIAFEGSGSQDFGLAAAIAVIIFLLVGGLALLQIFSTKITD